MVNKYPRTANVTVSLKLILTDASGLHADAALLCRSNGRYPEEQNLGETERQLVRGKRISRRGTDVEKETSFVCEDSLHGSAPVRTPLHPFK